MERGLYIGRFQPLHRGHLHSLLWCIEEVDELIVAKQDNTILLIQVKSSTRIPRIRGREVHNIIQMANKIRNSYPILSLVHPNLECNINKNTISFGNYLLNFYLLPEWISIDPIKQKTLIL